MKIISFIKNTLLLLTCLGSFLSFGQPRFENTTKGPKYLTFIRLTKSKIKEIVAKNEYKEWIPKIIKDGDTLLIHVVEPLLVAWDNDHEEYDTLNVIDHLLIFDSDSVCIKDHKTFIFSDNYSSNAFLATKDWSFKWKKSTIPDLFVSAYRFKLTMHIQQLTEQPKLVITYIYNKGMTKKEYESYFWK